MNSPPSPYDGRYKRNGQVGAAALSPAAPLVQLWAGQRIPRPSLGVRLTSRASRIRPGLGVRSQAA